VVDGKVVHHSNFPVCRITDDALTAVAADEVVTFHFKGGHTFQDEYRTNKAQVIEGSIWEAGAETDGLLLGVSFVSKGQILLNTIHISKEGSLSASEIDRGITVRTFPIQRGGAITVDKSTYH
jgi:hypothetical protein